jgi:precorrin-2 dehydrogenase/sirohydrochlorin ferrochelatase
MARYVPICVDVAGRRVLIVGGGQVGTQKARDFAESGANVVVISPAVTEELQGEAAAGRLALYQRPYRSGDAEGAFLVVVATNDPALNAAVFAEASARGQLVNVCDDPEHCTFIFPSRIERGPLTLSIFTHGTSPALSKRVRRELERLVGPEYGELAEMLATIRPEVRAAAGLTQPERQAIYERIVYSDLLYLLREGARSEAERRLASILAEVLPSTTTAE